MNEVPEADLYRVNLLPTPLGKQSAFALFLSVTHLHRTKFVRNGCVNSTGLSLCALIDLTQAQGVLLSY